MPDPHLSWAEVVSRVQSLEIPSDEYVIVGGAALTARNLRPATDIDLVVTERIYDVLKGQSWAEEIYRPTAGRPKRLLRGPFDVGTAWGKANYRPDGAALIRQAELVDSVPVIPVGEVLAWKLEALRDKDLPDIEMIRRHLMEDTR